MDAAYIARERDIWRSRRTGPSLPPAVTQPLIVREGTSLGTNYGTTSRYYCNCKKPGLLVRQARIGEDSASDRVRSGPIPRN